MTDALRYDAENVLVVHILSASIKGAEYEVEPHLLFNAYHRTTTALYVRKAPHSYGWDIMPRALSAGIWRDVTLTEECRYGFRYVYPHLQRIDGDRGTVKVVFDSAVPREYLHTDITYKITGTCGEHTFTATDTFKSPAGFFTFHIDGLKLWWPHPYGAQNLYDITMEATTADGKLHFTHTFRFGFRTLDPYRPYIPSSPYITDEAFRLGDKFFPENHLWGPRDYFKSDFYTGANAYFVSETGYHGCPARSSIEKFIDSEYVWPYFQNPQWKSPLLRSVRLRLPHDADAQAGAAALRRGEDGESLYRRSQRQYGSRQTADDVFR